MKIDLLILLTFGSVAVLIASIAMVLNDVVFRYRLLVRQRLDELSGKTKSEQNTTLFDLKLLAAQSSVSHGSLRSRVADFLEQAALPLTPEQFLGVALLTALVLGVAGAVAVRHWWILPLAAPLGMLLPYFYAHSRRAKRIRAIYRQLPDALDCMVRAVRAGQTVSTAFQLVADEFEPPLSDDFWYCYEQQQLGISYQVAMRALARRASVLEMRILVVALLVQVRSGGNLAETLSGLSAMARKRIKMQQRLKALTGEGRMQANVLIVLPLVALAALTLMSPEYAATLFKRPWLLGGMFVSELVGAIWIRQIVRPDF